MPELPDVEVYRGYLDGTALHQNVGCVEVESPTVLEGINPEELGRALKGRRFASTPRPW